ncbi:hypothetical protein L1856_10445 [Streptomyces sp. Tue 6430]|nr:hypothetical protein [Streptomyces sp. Tue 6430]
MATPAFPTVEEITDALGPSPDAAGPRPAGPDTASSRATPIAAHMSRAAS